MSHAVFQSDNVLLAPNYLKIRYTTQLGATSLSYYANEGMMRYDLFSFTKFYLQVIDTHVFMRAVRVGSKLGDGQKIFEYKLDDDKKYRYS